MLKPQRLILLVSLPLFLCVACSSPPKHEEATLAPTAILTQFASPSPTLLLETATSADLDLPTATPFVYSIQENETLVGLAERFGVSLDGILAANPGVDARFLSVGQEILIPAGNEQFVDGEIVATPTPLPLDTAMVACYSSAANELTCLLAVENDTAGDVENVAGVVQLFDAEGSFLASNAAVAPINLLPAGARIPLIAYWSNQPEGWHSASGQLVTAFPAADGGERYLEVELLNSEIQIAADGLSAFAEGAAQVAGGQDAGSLWILAVAFDEEGNAIGYRRWEGAGDEVEFEFHVYSLGPDIATVELYSEARP